MSESGSRRVGGAGGCPAIGAGIIPPTSVESIPIAICPSPHDHFTAGPDRRVSESDSGRVGGAGCCPTVGSGIVSPASVQSATATPPPQTIISLPVQTAV